MINSEFNDKLSEINESRNLFAYYGFEGRVLSVNQVFHSISASLECALWSMW